MIVKQKNKENKSSNNKITGFEVMYYSSSKQDFTRSAEYHKLLERVYEKQRKDDNDT